MTIELGFAELGLGSTCFGIVDVPGHERFVRTMVQGATGIDLALIVVAADDSVMPQTIEHVEILHLLGVRLGAVAVTKTDMVDGEMVELVVEDVRSLLADTPLASAPICPVSSTTGAGIEDLKGVLGEVAEKVGATSTALPFRMAVDRVFVVQGRGTVVTGSVLRGRVSEGDTLEVWPAGTTCRVRGLQTHGAAADSLARGQRAAINVSGIDRVHLPRGAELATPGYLQHSRMIDVRLNVLPACDRPVKSASTVRLEVGAAEVSARVVFPGGDAQAPGSSVYAQLRCGEPLTATYGQRFILRNEGATRTIGGGVVLRPLALRKRRNWVDDAQRLERLAEGDEIDRVEEALRAARFTRPTDVQLCARTGVEEEALPSLLDTLEARARWVEIGGTGVRAVPGAVDDLAARLAAWLERHHERHPELPGRGFDTVQGYLERLTSRSLARALLDTYLERGILKRLGRFVCLPAFAPSLSGADEKLMAGMIEEIRAGGFQPPGLEAVSGYSPSERKRWTRLATLAVAMGELVQVDSKIFLHADAESQLREAVSGLVREGGGVTVARVREALGSSRKYVVPFLEYLDRLGFTKRTGDERILGEVRGE